MNNKKHRNNLVIRKFDFINTIHIQIFVTSSSLNLISVGDFRESVLQCWWTVNCEGNPMCVCAEDDRNHGCDQQKEPDFVFLRAALSFQESEVKRGRLSQEVNNNTADFNLKTQT